MWDRYGTAVMEERRHDRRFAALEAYLQSEYGSASGMERYLAETNHISFPRSGLRAFLAKVARAVSRSSTEVATPAASAEQVLSEECAEHAVPPAQGVIAPRARPLTYRRALDAGRRAVLPPLKR